jgi:glycosyltransferase involved in cell wall biosynthesis
MQNIYITVITITYNVEDALEGTIKSIINQDYQNLEYIVIDGASSDNTINIIKKYEKYITKWISEPDNGIYDAMNKGIEMASGEYINFMHAGDTFASNDVISKVVQNAENIDMVCGDIYNNINGEYKYQKAAGLSEIYNGFFTFCCHQALFAKTKFLKKYKFDTTYKMAADFDFILKCYHDKCTFKFLDIAIANFANNGASKKNRVLTRVEEMFILTKYIDNYENIYSMKPFLRLLDYNSNNNRLFASMYNYFIKSLEELNLNEKKFVLYGYGNIGKFIYEKYGNNIIKIVDLNYQSLNKLYTQLTIEDISSLSSLDFDFILVTVLGREDEITTLLSNKYNIPKSKILYLDTSNK